jgi:aminopeptidase-like protein
VLISTHVCHPSLCDDNLSGVVVAAFLARHLSRYPRRYSYRFLFIPGTIGAIAWLSRNESRTPLIRHGLVLRCLGNTGPLTYTKSRRGAAEIDRVFDHALRARGREFTMTDFALYGDERQFSSPAFDLPVGCLTRAPDGTRPEHHTSADDLGFVTAEALADSLAAGIGAIEILDGNRRYVTLNPRCEPQYARRGVFHPVGEALFDDRALRWVLNLSDGRHSVVDIAERSGCSFRSVAAAAVTLRHHGLLDEVEP